MKLEDFKRITKTHIETCKSLISMEGKCKYTPCKQCPFHKSNLINKDRNCFYYRGWYKERFERDWKLSRNAKMFMKMINNK